MEYLFFIAILIALFLFMILQEIVQSRKNEKKFAEKLREEYGHEQEKEYSVERFARLGSFWERHKAPGQIDDITWNDLGMDAVFRRIDHTFSAAGEEYLYYLLHNTCSTEEELAHLEEGIRWIMEHPEERVRIQLQMYHMGHLGKYSLYDYFDNLDYLGERSSRGILLSDLLYVLFAGVTFFQPTVGGIGILICMLGHILFYFRERKKIEPYITSFAYVLRLVDSCEELQKLKIPVWETEHLRMQENLKSLRELKRGSFWIMTGNHGSIGGNPLDIIADYIRMTLHLDILQFNRMLRKLREKQADVEGLLTVTGAMEAAISIGAFRQSLVDYCIPEFLPETKKELTLTEGWHPLLADPVKNSLQAKGGILLTGSNASGKSTFLKTVAVNAVLAQTIHTCTAAAYRAPLFRIYSSMALRDNMEAGESYYIVEIRSLKRILDASDESGRPVLGFVDEVLRGTNTVERIAAATQILTAMSRKNALCFAATHDIEMTELLRDSYENYHFEEEIRDGDIFFPYQLLPGKASTKNAIRLLEMMGYAPEITERAARQAEDFLHTGKWKSI